MEKLDTWKNILKYLGEVLLVTIVWSILDYFWGNPLNIISNLIRATIIVLIVNMSEYIIVKKLKKKIENNS